MFSVNDTRKEIKEVFEAGFSIIPVKEDKKPPISWKQYQTTPATEKVVDRWINQYKAFAIVTGKISRCFVLDFDGEAGLDTLKRLGLNSHVKTPDGGIHVYFHYPESVEKVLTTNSSKVCLNDLYPSVDIRGDGGYAIFSGHISKGDYKFGGIAERKLHDIGDLPQDLQDIITCKNTTTNKYDYYNNSQTTNTPDDANSTTAAYTFTHSIEKQENEIPMLKFHPDKQDIKPDKSAEKISVEKILTNFGDYKQYGGRNNAMFNLGCQLRDNGYKKDEIFVIVSNYARKLPDNNMHGDHEPLTTNEIASTINSVFSKDKREAWDISNSMSQEDFILSERCTDTGNKLVFIEKHKDKLKCALSLKSAEWFIWNGKAWAEDRLQTINDMVEKEVRSWYADIESVGDDVTKTGRAKKAKFAKHVDRSLSKSSRDNLISLSTTSPEVACVRSIFDQNDYLLNFQNGTLNLKTKVLYPHKKEDLITKLLKVDYNPNAKCPQFLKFLNEIFCSDSDLIDYIQKLFGYCLTGDTREQKFWMFVGKGSNGKSTLLDLFRDILGEYATTQPADSLTLDKFGNSGKASNDVTMLEGKRLAIASETQEGLQFNEQKLKNLTESVITARELYKDYREIRITHKTILGCNHPPVIRGLDIGIWRRIKRIDFTQIFDDSGAPGTLPLDLHLGDKLRKEYEGILAWAVEGCYKYIAEGLSDCKAMKDATDAYKAEMDTLGNFLSDCCRLADGQRETSSSYIYKKYREWCEECGFKGILNIKNFARQLEDKGFQKKRIGSGIYWIGIEVDSIISFDD